MNKEELAQERLAARAAKDFAKADQLRDEIAALGELTGAEFDQAWATAMIAHHKGAIKMAKTVKEDGKSTPVQDLANLIVQEQQSEITVLETLLG